MSTNNRGLNCSYPVLVILFVLAIRILSIGTADLIDPTESRYAFVAQEMVLSGDWITPKLPLPSGLEAYTGKPPLHFWLTAACITLFGMDSWVPRLPSVFEMLIISLCIWLFTREHLAKEARLLAITISATAGLFFFISGSSTVDITFSAWISAAITCFAIAGQLNSNRTKQLAGYGFFASLALAFLTKGPAAFIIVGATIFFWLLKREHRQLFPTLPWITGTLLFLVIATPWFILSAQRDPEFLYYFFVQENFMRFVTKDYGDRFGTGHVYPRGSALWMLLAGFLPWSLLWGARLFKPKELFSQVKSFSPWLLLALSWGITPALFFSAARQLHAAYLLPGFGGLAIVMATLIESQNYSDSTARLFRLLRVITLIAATSALVASLFFNVSTIGFITALCLLGCAFACNQRRPNTTLESALTWALLIAFVYGITLFGFGSHASRIKSARQALTQIIPQLDSTDQTLVFLSHNSYSFYYYPRMWKERGQPSVATDFATLEEIQAGLPENLVVNRGDLKRFSAELQNKYQERGEFGKWRWWQKKP